MKICFEIGQPTGDKGQLPVYLPARFGTGWDESLQSILQRRLLTVAAVISSSATFDYPFAPPLIDRGLDLEENGEPRLSRTRPSGGGTRRKRDLGARYGSQGDTWRGQPRAMG